MSSQLCRWTPALLWAALIFGTSCTVITRHGFVSAVGPLVPGSHGDSQAFEAFWVRNWVLFVKGWHFTEFAILTLLTTRGLHGRWAPAAFLCATYAALDEWHQTFVPDRGGRWTDVAIDCAGILAACLLLALRKRRPIG